MNRVEILDLQPVINFNRALFASLAVHVVVFVGALSGAGKQSSLPLGVRRLGDPTIIEVGLGPQATHAKVAVMKRSDDIVMSSESEIAIKKKKQNAKKKEEIAQGAESDHLTDGSASPGRFGLKDGLATEGRMGVGNGVDASEQERYIYELRVLLEGRKIYPKVSRYMHETGKVTVRFIIQQDGKIDLVEVTKPSSFSRLNQAASDLVSGLKKYKPLPDGVATASLSIEVPIEYILN